MNIKWRKVTQKYGPPKHYAMVGKVHVATVDYYAMRSKNDPNKAYEYRMLLPGLVMASGKRETVEEAKARAEVLINTWFTATEDK